MKPKLSTGYLTPQAMKSNNTSKLRRSESNENLNIAKDFSDSFLQKLMSCPVKRQLVLHLINSDKVSLEDFMRNPIKENKASASPLSKIKKKTRCESPTALLRRRILEQQNRQIVPEDHEPCQSEHTSRSSSRQSSVSSCPSPVPFEKLLEGVVAYVEVKSNDQDRSASAKALMASMGATVRDKFMKDVTHVIFKDGSFTTYQKAKLMKVHLVSVLWIEAVRSNNMRVPEKKFPALGTEAYNNNVSSLCSQLQKEYEEMIRDELHRSLATGTPLPPTQTLIDRRRTLMTPIHFPSRLSQEFCSSQDLEVDSILRTRRKTCSVMRTESPLATILSPDLISDDDSDLGHFIDGKMVQRQSTSVIPNLVENSRGLSRLQKSKGSDMDLTFADSSTPLAKINTPNLSRSNMDITVLDNVLISDGTLHGNAKENCTPNISEEGIFNHKTPKLKSDIKKNCESKKDKIFNSPDENLYKRRTRQLFSSNDVPSNTNINVISNKSSESSPKSNNLQILSKNMCITTGSITKTSDDTASRTVSTVTVDKSSSTNMSSLQISTSREKLNSDKVNEIQEVSAGTNMSSLLISDVNKDKAVNTSDRNNVDTNSNASETNSKAKSTNEKRTGEGKESFSPLGSPIVQDVLEILDTIHLNDENITKRRKRQSMEKITYNTRRRTMLPSDDKSNNDSSSSLKETGSDVTDVTPPKQKTRRNEPAKEKLNSSLLDSKKNKRNKTVVDKNPVLVKRTSKKVELQTTKQNCNLSDSSQNSSTSSESNKKLNKTRKLYNPDQYIEKMSVNNELERDIKRNEAKKRKSNESVPPNTNIVTISPNTLLTAKAKEFIDKNKIDIKEILNKNSEESENEPTLIKKRKTPTNRRKQIVRNSEADEQRQLAVEFVNKQRDETNDESANKRKELIKRRKSARLSQHQKKKLNSDSSTSGADEKNIKPLSQFINRRSTMEFQTESQMNSNRKLKIDKIKRPSIVCTKLHKEDIQVFNQIVRKLGGFVIEDEVSRKTTHLIAGEPKRTINMLRAMTMGCWILKHEWLLRSLEEGKWLPEEDYEETDFSSAVQKCRLQRQAFGPTYTMDIFQDCGPIYIAKGTIPRCSDLKELVSLCKGNICEIPRNAAIVVGEYVRYDSIKCVGEAWILDSITYNKKMPLKKYIIKPTSSSSPVV